MYMFCLQLYANVTCELSSHVQPNTAGEQVNKLKLFFYSNYFYEGKN